MPSGGLLTAAVVMGGAQTGLGLFQSIRAAKQRKQAQRDLLANPYRTPEAATRSVNLMGELAQGSRMPGQDIIENNIRSATAEGISRSRDAATSPSQVLSSTIDMFMNEQKQRQDLDLAAAQDYRMRQTAYAQAVASLAPYEEKKWEYNTLYPAQAMMGAAAQGSAAGMQNIAGGVSSAFSAYANNQYLQGMQSPSASGFTGYGSQGAQLGQIAQTASASYTPTLTNLLTMPV